jgi:hypothetical protein
MYELLMIIMSVLPVGLIPEMDLPGLFVVIVSIFQMLYINTKCLIWMASTAASYVGVLGLKS